MRDELKKVLLFSGGLDSAATWWWLRSDWFHVRGSARAAEKGQTQAIDKMCVICPEFAKRGHIKDLDFSPFMRGDDWNFPRDFLLVNMAWAEGWDQISMGWHKDDFVEDVSRIGREYAYEIAVGKWASVRFPVSMLSQTELIQKALELGCPLEFLQASHSCVSASGAHCGHCVNCAQRWMAFKAADLEDVTVYANDPLESGAVALEVKKRGHLPWWKESYARLSDKLAN